MAIYLDNYKVNYSNYFSILYSYTIFSMCKNITIYKTFCSQYGVRMYVERSLYLHYLLLNPSARVGRNIIANNLVCSYGTE